MPKLGRVLLLGGSGQLGTAIRRGWTDVTIDAPRRAALDAADAIAVSSRLSSVGAEALINCTAFHDLERCERDPELAFAMNALAVGALAEVCARLSVIFITISTDYVFDGELGRPYRESDAPNPINVYGTSKYAGELLTLRLQSQAYVVRTCGVYSNVESAGRGAAFPVRALRQAGAGSTPRAVMDRVISPTYAADLAAGLRAMVEANAPFGLYHLVNEGATTWYEFLVEAARMSRITTPITPISHRDWPSGLRRPEYSALENSRLYGLGIRVAPWRDALSRFLKTEP